MLRTLTIGSCVSVQGRFVRSLADGRIVVAVGDKQFTGYPTRLTRPTRLTGPERDTSRMAAD